MGCYLISKIPIISQFFFIKINFKKPIVIYFFFHIKETIDS